MNIHYFPHVLHRSSQASRPKDGDHNIEVVLRDGLILEQYPPGAEMYLSALLVVRKP